MIYPTETCYGMGVDATNEAAVKRLLEYKGGRQNKAISVAVGSRRMAEELVSINEIADNLYENFLPGPITVVSKSRGKVVRWLESERGNLGIRIPDHQIALALIEAYGEPITATSANTSGKKQPYSWQDLVKYTSQKKLRMIGGMIDVGPLPLRETSTVVDTTLNQLTVLRQGEVKLKQDNERVVTDDEKETRRLGKRIMKAYVDKLSTKPLVIGLQGELGAGKTQLVKGMAQALGITETIVSPTYQIMREYDHECGKLGGKLVHVDTWRLHEGDELWDLGLEEYLVPGNVVAIEWVEKMGKAIRQVDKKTVVLWIRIESGDNRNERVVIYGEESKL